MNRKDKRYFNLAKAVSYTSDYPRVHIGSVIIKNKEIVAVSANQKKSHPLQQKLNPIRFDNHTSQSDIDKCNNYQMCRKTPAFRHGDIRYNKGKHIEKLVCRHN